MTHLEQVRAKIIEACGLEKIANAEEEMGLPYELTLADVLRAIDQADPSEFHIELLNGSFLMRKGLPRDEWRTYGKNFIQCLWNLALSLDEQEQEVIEFLYKVLCD